MLDVDDTALSSYSCLKKVDFKRTESDCATPGTMPPIRQTRALYDYARRHGVTVFFITGRRTTAPRDDDCRNLHRAGFGGHLNVRLRPNHEPPGTHDGWKARTRADSSRAATGSSRTSATSTATSTEAARCERSSFRIRCM